MGSGNDEQENKIGQWYNCDLGPYQIVLISGNTIRMRWKDGDETDAMISAETAQKDAALGKEVMRKIDIPPIGINESPRKIFVNDFPNYGEELPICGGWGYSKEDACVIDKNDPIVNQAVPFNGVAVEYAFVEKRNLEELIIFRPGGKTYAGIRSKLIKQELIHDGPRHFDRLLIEVSMHRDSDWQMLKNEWEGSNGHVHPEFDVQAHEEERQDLLVRVLREFWFDITSFHGSRREDNYGNN